MVLSIVPPIATDALRVRAFDKDIAAYKDGDTWRAIVGVDLDVKPGTYRVAVESRGAENISRGNLRPEDCAARLPHAAPDGGPGVRDAAGIRTAAHRARVGVACRGVGSSAASRLWTTAFVRPVPQAANSAFGTRSIFNGKPRNSHGGADFLSPAGTPIQAPNAGRIAVARSLYFSGNTVIIDHGLGVFSTLAHLSRIDVEEGEMVTPGQRVGLVGATGRVTGAHLHWAVRAGDARVDPLSLLAVLGVPDVAK